MNRIAVPVWIRIKRSSYLTRVLVIAEPFSIKIILVSPGPIPSHIGIIDHAFSICATLSRSPYQEILISGNF